MNFDILLPNRAPISNEEFTFKVIGGSNPSVSLIPKNQRKPKVTDINSWMVAWNNFIRCYNLYYPNQTQELIRYQAIIADFASQYIFTAWSQHDRSFRYQIAFNQSLPWHRVDDDLYNRYLRGTTIQDVCFLCRNFGHFASQCFTRGGAQGQSNEPLQPIRHAQQRVGNPANRQEFFATRTCDFFNSNGQCHNQRCRFSNQ